MIGSRDLGGIRDRRRDEQGFVAVLVVLLLSSVLFGLAAIGVDLSRLYLEAQRVQRAADAAALGSVSYMPQDLPSARASSYDISARNSYPNSGTSSVSVTQGAKPSQLRVTVCSTIKNTFGAIIGVPQATVCRSAVADYTGPQPMGSPCNTMGNEPAGTPGAPPAASQLKIPSPATCSTNPQFWVSAAGPNVYKTQGDQYGTRYCQGGESDCTGTDNNDFDPNGYFLLVRVAATAVNQPVTLQLYDPAYVSTESQCTSGPSGSIPTINRTNYSSTNNWNPYTTTDALTRYHMTGTYESPNSFCSGDSDNNGLRRGNETATVTSFGLRAPVDNLNPLSATPVAGCTRQYPGYTSPTNSNLIAASPSYNQSLAAVFHEWKTLCTFTPPAAGDYYLQVRTNVAMQGAVNDDGSYKPANAANSTMFTQRGDDLSVTGNGTNRFAVRAYGAGIPAGGVSVSAYGKMPIFANSDSATSTFNLIRVLPGAAGKTLLFTFFDVGDAASNGTMTVLRPSEATGDQLSNCSASGFKTATLSGCSISGIKNSNGWNGQSETIAVPIPPNYNCTSSSAGGCWFRVQVGFGSGSVTDATTWTASITGDPVRLIE